MLRNTLLGLAAAVALALTASAASAGGYGYGYGYDNGYTGSYVSPTIVYVPTYDGGYGY